MANLIETIMNTNFSGAHQNKATTYFISTPANFTAEKITLLICYTILIISGTVGNSMVIKWFISKREIAGSKFVIVLAITDLLNSIASSLVVIHGVVSDGLHPRLHWPPRWYLGEIICRLIMGFPNTFLCASPWLLVAISIERYR